MDSRRGGHESPAQPEGNDTIVSRLAQQDKVPWYSKPNLRLLYFLMATTCLGVEMTSGQVFDSSMVNALQAVPSWLEYFHHPRSTSLGLIVAMYSLGSFAAVPFSPLVVDKIGRRYPILFGGVASIVGGIIQGSAFNLPMFIIARFLLGFANVFCIVAASSLIGELSHPKERVVISCLFNTAYSLGAVAAAGVALGTFAMTSNWGWRIPSLLQVFPSLLQVSFIWFLPESPRWLISRGRGNEAYAILVKYHAEGDENSEFVKAEYTQIEETLVAELKISRMNQKTVLSTPGMRKRVIIASFLGLSVQWSGIGLITQFLSQILDSIGIHDNQTKNVINLTRSSWSLVSGTFIALIAPRYPRRWTFLAGAVSIYVVFTAWTIASAEYSSTHNRVSAQVVLALIFLYSPAYHLAFNALIFSEHYALRATLYHSLMQPDGMGIAIYQWWCRGAGFISEFVNPIGLDFAGWRWYIVYCVWNAFQVVFVYLMFPETSGRTLEELTFYVIFSNLATQVSLFGSTPPQCKSISTIHLRISGHPPYVYKRSPTNVSLGEAGSRRVGDTMTTMGADMWLQEERVLDVPEEFLDPSARLRAKTWMRLSQEARRDRLLFAALWICYQVA
ncbi:MFS general substrate transporter [Imleria badia]|nr:MFS general substrate transporter [Imleria badia]